MLSHPKLARRYAWIGQTIDKIVDGQLANAVIAGVTAEGMLTLLESLGLVKCTSMWEQQVDVSEAKKFVQGICQPGSY